MSNFYDPWAHAVSLFFSRVLQFIALSALLGLGAWAALLHWYFAVATWSELASWTLDIAQHSNRHWRGVFVLCMTIAALLVGWLFTTVSLLSHLRSGERHHRGARVVNHSRD
jgi:hypothetical protein